MKPGEVRAVRELSKGTVQAKVCLGADPRLGYAWVSVETTSPKVLEAMEVLKDALREDTKTFVGNVLKGQKAWDEVRHG